MKPVLAGFIKMPSIIAMIALLCPVLYGGEFHLQLKTRTVYIIPMANGLDVTWPAGSPAQLWYGSCWIRKMQMPC